MKQFIAMLFATAFIATSNVSSAAQLIWKGSQSTDWNANANWSGGNRPGTNDDVLIDGTGTVQPVLSANASIKSLSITGGSLDLNGKTLTVSGTSVISGGSISNGTIDDLTINFASGSMTLAGTLNISSTLTFIKGIVYTTNTNLLTINDNVAVTGSNTNSYVDGPVRKIGNDTFLFPTGNNGLYAPIWISAPSNTSDHFTAQYFKSAYSNTTSIASGLNNVSTMEHWILNRTNGSSSVNVKLYFNSALRSGPVNDLADLRVSRFNGSQWVSHGNGGTTGTTTSGTVITSSAVTSFSPFTLASNMGLNPLPVKLVSFDAVNVNNNVNIRWASASEENNDFYTVEKSINGTTWTKVATVKGQGTTYSLNNYQVVDNNISASKIFYRLKQTNFDGTFSYSDIKAVNTSFNTVTVAAYPNPAKDVVTVNVNNEEALNTTLTLMNMQGQVVFSTEMSNTGSFTMDIANQQNGIYFLEVKNESGISKIKIVKE